MHACPPYGKYLEGGGQGVGQAGHEAERGLAHLVGQAQACTCPSVVSGLVEWVGGVEWLGGLVHC